MARELWKGAISFGLVHVPVDLYPGEKSNELKFTLLDRRNMAPVGYRRINKETGKVVPPEEIVKGYEHEKERYVVLSDEDFRQANVKATQTIEIMAFIQDDEINSIYFDKPYFLTPGKGGAKGYALLREVLRRTRKIGIANLVIHTRQHLAAVMVQGEILLLQLLRYAYELRDPEELDVSESDPGSNRIAKKELDMAERLVEGMTEKWDPLNYHDSYADDLMALVQKKIKAGRSLTITEPEPESDRPRGDNVIDLMKLLKRSLETGKASAKGAAARKGHVASKAVTAKRRSRAQA